MENNITELTVISSLLRFPAHRENYLDRFQALDFQDRVNRNVLVGLQAMRSQSYPVTPESVQSWFSDQQEESLRALVCFDGSYPEMTQEDVSAVKEMGRRAVLRGVRDLIGQKLKNPAVDVDGLTGEVRTMLDGLGERAEQDGSDSAEQTEIACEEMNTWNEATSKIRTFLPEIDSKLFLSRLNGTLSVVGGRSNLGKTSWLLQVAHENALAGNPTIYFPLEQSATRVRFRLALRDPVMRGRLFTEENLGNAEFRADLEVALRNLALLPLKFYDTTNNIYKICTISRRESQAVLPGRRLLVVVDYVQLCRTNNVYDDGIARTATASGELALLKKPSPSRGWPELTVVTASQYTKEGTKDNVRPINEFLYGASSLINDADNIFHLHQYVEQPEQDEGRYRPSSRGTTAQVSATPRLVDEVKLFCGKQRDFPPGWEVPMIFDRGRQTFSTPGYNSMRNSTIDLEQRRQRPREFSFQDE